MAPPKDCARPVVSGMLGGAAQVLSPQFDQQVVEFPKCEGHGQAVPVAVGDTARIVDYICSRCAHQWFETLEHLRGRVLPFSRATRMN